MRHFLFGRTASVSRSADLVAVNDSAVRGSSQRGLSMVSIMRTFSERVPMALTGMRILVVEDAHEVLDVFTLLLRIEGAEAAGAASGRVALSLFESRHFDVVISDLGLPDIP